MVIMLTVVWRYRWSFGIKHFFGSTWTVAVGNDTSLICKLQRTEKLLSRHE